MGIKFSIPVFFLACVHLAGQGLENNPLASLFFPFPESGLVETPWHFETRVNNIEQFIGRINLEMDHFGNRVDEAKRDLSQGSRLSEKDWAGMRQAMVWSLCDPSVPDRDVSAFRRLTEYMKRKPPDIRLADEKWFAVVGLPVYYNGEARQAYMILAFRAKGKGYGWGIRDLILDPAVRLKKHSPGRYERPVPDASVFLTPEKHEIGFLGLDTLLNQGYLRQLWDGASQPGTIDLVQDNVMAGQIRFGPPQKISYAFLQVPDLMLVVDYFNRTAPNSGWLISRVLENHSTCKPLEWIREGIISKEWSMNNNL